MHFFSFRALIVHVVFSRSPSEPSPIECRSGRHCSENDERERVSADFLGELDPGSRTGWLAAGLVVVDCMNEYVVLVSVFGRRV